MQVFKGRLLPWTCEILWALELVDWIIPMESEKSGSAAENTFAFWSQNVQYKPWPVVKQSARKLFLRLIVTRPAMIGMTQGSQIAVEASSSTPVLH